MQNVPGNIILSKDEYKAKKALEEAGKRGLISISQQDSAGNSSYTINAPKGHRNAWSKKNKSKNVQQGWLGKLVAARQSNNKVSKKEGTFMKKVYKYRKGACKNCGAMTHTAKQCIERPRKVGAKFSGSNFKGDEESKQVGQGYDEKRDRWSGYVSFDNFFKFPIAF